MAFTDQLKAALKKKQAAQHPDTEDAAKETGKKTKPAQQVVVNRPTKKVTGRGR